MLKPFVKENLRRDPEWILTLIKERRPYKLPVFVDTEVFEQIVSDFVDDDWLGPCLELVREYSELLTDTVENVITKDAKVCRFPRLRDFLLHRIEEAAEESIGQAEKEVREFIRREKVPYTQNHYLNENVCRLRFEPLKDALHIALGLDTGSDSDVLKKSSVESIIEGVFDRNQRKSVDEHMAEDMEHALDAYGKVSLKRFIDVVPMICSDAMLGFPSKMNKVLFVADSDLEKLVCGSRDDVEKRERLKRKIADLDEGLKMFDDLL